MGLLKCRKLLFSLPYQGSLCHLNRLSPWTSYHLCFLKFEVPKTLLGCTSTFCWRGPAVSHRLPHLIPSFSSPHSVIPLIRVRLWLNIFTPLVCTFPALALHLLSMFLLHSADFGESDCLLHIHFHRVCWWIKNNLPTLLWPEGTKWQWEWVDP